MYCNKCGGFAEDGARFCDSCGAPLENNSGQEPVKGKKPMSKKAKLIIIFGAVGAAAIAVFLVLLFTVILPKEKEEERVDLGNYFTVSFTEAEGDGGSSSIVDGEISGMVGWNYKDFAEDNNISKEKARTILDTIDDYLVIRVLNDGKEQMGNNFTGADEDTVLSVSVRWMNASDLNKTGFEYVGGDDEDYQKFVMDAVENYEDEWGIKFKRDEMTGAINIRDELEKQGIKVIKKVELDVLGYVKGGNYYSRNGYRSGDMEVVVDAFKTEIDGYTVEKADSISYTPVTVTDSQGNVVARFCFDYSKSGGLNDGDVVTISYDESSVENFSEDKLFVFTGESIDVTISAPESLNRDNVKNYAEALKLFFTQKARDDDADEGDVFELKNIYYSCDGYYYGDEYVVFSFYNATKKYYNSIRFKNTQVYIEDGAVHFTPQGYFESSSPDKSLDEFLKHFHEIDESKHTVIKVM